MSGSNGPDSHPGISSPWKIETHKLVAPKHFDVEPVDMHKEIVVVTGGSGFLGQHIVKHMLEQNEFPIREVRVFDMQPFELCSGFGVIDSSITLRQFQGDICNQAHLEKAFAGATVVIHNASVIDTSSIPDKVRLHRINVQGTETVLRTCVYTNVKYLIYTSSVIAGERIGAYGISKRLAEDLVLQANGRQVKNGEKLRTCALRPVAIYGEGDSQVVSIERLIINNSFCRLGDDAPRFQCAYAVLLIKAQKYDFAQSPIAQRLSIQLY
ncbi:3 beta-hydroxysteroid dehydrogenase type 7-like [Amphiura filiformis]|uniref:3 beta-hydroxysteroid dehydrogenase type 7-like n=1 Tax=Amphiura filiformis TaxID=82378 RepID=UPI003B2242F7